MKTRTTNQFQARNPLLPSPLPSLQQVRYSDYCDDLISALLLLPFTHHLNKYSVFGPLGPTAFAMIAAISITDCFREKRVQGAQLCTPPPPHFIAEQKKTRLLFPLCLLMQSRALSTHDDPHL
jgi:hypothetical protein